MFCAIISGWLLPLADTSFAAFYCVLPLFAVSARAFAFICIFRAYAVSARGVFRAALFARARAIFAARRAFDPAFAAVFARRIVTADYSVCTARGFFECVGERIAGIALGEGGRCRVAGGSYYGIKVHPIDGRVFGKDVYGHFTPDGNVVLARKRRADISDSARPVRKPAVRRAASRKVIHCLTVDAERRIRIDVGHDAFDGSSALSCERYALIFPHMPDEGNERNAAEKCAEAHEHKGQRERRKEKLRARNARIALFAKRGDLVARLRVLVRTVDHDAAILLAVKSIVRDHGSFAVRAFHDARHFGNDGSV